MFFNLIAGLLKQPQIVGPRLLFLVNKSRFRGILSEARISCRVSRNVQQLPAFLRSSDYPGTDRFANQLLPVLR